MLLESLEEYLALRERLNQTLIAKGRRWRKEPPTDKQREFAERLKVWVPGMSRGACAEAITHKLTLRVIQGKHVWTPAPRPFEASMQTA